jgi:MFS family permease
MALMLVAFAAALASALAAGGSLRRLAHLELRATWTVFAALAAQLLVLGVLDERATDLHGAAHVATYGLTAGFLWANRRLRGLWLVAVGAGANLAAIVANGGVMPASPSALATAGLEPGRAGGFANSAAVVDADLALLGDVLAIPASWPLSNVLSVGDLLIALGIVVVLHGLCGSRLVPAHGGDLAQLARDPRFARVWTAQAVSNLGDYVYTLAVTLTVVGDGRGVATIATLLIVQTACAALVGLLGAPLVDRLDRRVVMVAADLVRAAAVGSLLLAGDPATVHVLLVAACLGSLGALFQPALQASLPNLVPQRLLVTANALVTGTFHVAVLAGPVLGALLAGSLGVDVAFAVNTATFLVSALLLVGVRLPRAAAQRQDASDEGPRALVAGLRHIVATPLLRGVVLTTGAAMFAAAIKQPGEPLLVVRGLGGGAGEVGLVVAAWGLGMIAGCAATPALTRRVPREALTAGALALMGAAIAVAAAAGAVVALLGLWLLGGAGNGVLSVVYETLLQERTPDRLRGRVVAANEAGLDVASWADSPSPGPSAAPSRRRSPSCSPAPCCSPPPPSRARCSHPPGHGARGWSGLPWPADRAGDEPGKASSQPLGRLVGNPMLLPTRQDGVPPQGAQIIEVSPEGVDRGAPGDRDPPERDLRRRCGRRRGRPRLRAPACRRRRTHRHLPPPAAAGVRRGGQDHLPSAPGHPAPRAGIQPPSRWRERLRRRRPRRLPPPRALLGRVPRALRRRALGVPRRELSVPGKRRSPSS